MDEGTAVPSPHSFHKYFMSTYYFPDTGLDARDIAISKIKQLSVLRLHANGRDRPGLEHVSLEFKDIGAGRLGLDSAQSRETG